MNIYPTQDQVKTLFDYKDGGLYWRVQRPCIEIGQRAGYTGNSGYRIININRKNYREHRLVWLWHYGTMPLNQLDHINRIRNDNRIENLRECTTKENHQNRSIGTNNTSGHIGVSWDKKPNKWKAHITVDGKSSHLGYFERLEDAVAARLNAQKLYHTFAN